jgi:hypothetical protein
MLEWSLFGDPTLAAENGDNPINIPEYRAIPYGIIARLIETFPILSRFLELI